MKSQLLILLYLLSCNLFTQAQVDISGQVKDAQTKKPLEFCSVAVLNAKDSLIAGSVTDEKGFFVIPVKKGKYHLVLSYIGYKNDTSQNFLCVENKFLGVFKMDPSVTDLKEVSVTVSSRENQLDRDVQIVTDKMKAGASNTKEVLEKINGVSYDRYNNSVKVDNNDKVIILVDGMEKDQEYIKNLSPDRLKKVEVIRDPGGRYALEGYSAVINVILKKDYQGAEVFVSERGMFDLDAVRNDYIPVQSTFNSTINYTYNKLNVYTSYGNNINNFNLQSTVVRRYNNDFVIEKLFDNNEMNTKVKQMSNNFTLGADYSINPKHTLSFESNINNQPSGMNISREHYNINYFKNGVLTDNYLADSRNSSSNMSSYNSLFYEAKFDENNILKTNFTYSNYNSSYSNTYLESRGFNRSEDGSDIKNATKFYLEFYHDFSNKTSIQAGYGNTWDKLINNFSDGTTQSDFTYKNIKHKLFAYYSWQKSKTVSFKLGCASETNSVDAGGQHKTYLIFQPYADVKFKPSELFDTKVKYRSKANYPDISQTNPFSVMVDQKTFRTGNPDLSPGVTHTVSIQNNILQGLVAVEPYVHYSDNYITITNQLGSDSITRYSYSNAGKYLQFGVEGRFIIPFSESLIFKTDFDVFNSRISYYGKQNKIIDWSMKNELIYQNKKYNVVSGLQFQKNMVKRIEASGYTKSDNDYLLMFVQKPFFKERLEVMLIYFFPLNWGVDYDQGEYMESISYTEKRSNDISILKNIVMLQVSYRFNKGKSVTKTEKLIEKEKEKRGLF